MSYTAPRWPVSCVGCCIPAMAAKYAYVLFGVVRETLHDTTMKQSSTLHACCTALLGIDIDINQDVVTSPARSAVQAALAAIAEAQSAAPAGAPGASSAAALDAVGMAQAALDRRDSAAAELGAVSSDDTPPRDESAGPAGGGPSHDDGSNQHGRTREPQSAHWSRNNPAASHSHMAHLLW